MDNLKVGDLVYNKTLPTTRWIIEKIEDGQALCSTVIKETLEKKEEKFSIISLEKIDESIPSFKTIPRSRNHMY